MGKIFDVLEKARQDRASTRVKAPDPLKMEDVAVQGQNGDGGMDRTDSGVGPWAVHRPGTGLNKPVPLSDSVPELSTPELSVPELPDNLHPSIVTLLKPHSLEAEQFRVLKNNILFPEKGTPPRTIMITSPSPNEGKSFVSANLAVSIAKSIDEYVLLMDCDLRAPSLHLLFGIGENKGLSDHLSHAMPLSALLKKTFINKLTLLPAGTIPPNPSELLSSEQMRSLLHEVKSRYMDRYVIIDTPPPNLTSETNAIARIVDGIVIVIRHGKTRQKAVQDIIDVYGKQKILGVIKNFSTKKPVSNYPYNHYGYPS